VILLVGLTVTLSLVFLAPALGNVLFTSLMYLVALGFPVFFPHCLAHYLVGRLTGVRFDYYSVGKSGVAKLRLPFVSVLGRMLPVLTLKVNRSSLRSVNRERVSAMFKAGAVASMLLPFVAACASIHHLPSTLSLTLVLVATANLLFDLYYSPKAGDFARAKSFYGSG
jgi:hypothetical protein